MEKETLKERKKFRYEQNLIKKRERAIDEKDGVAYIQTTLELGYDLDEIPGLADEGYSQMVLDTGKSMNLGGLEEISLELDKELKRQLEFTKIINLSTLSSIRQSKTRLKLKGILGKLKKKGYDTNYSPNMNNSEMWKCYFKARRDILSL